MHLQDQYKQCQSCSIHEGFATTLTRTNTPAPAKIPTRKERTQNKRQNLIFSHE